MGKKQILPELIPKHYSDKTIRGVIKERRKSHLACRRNLMNDPLRQDNDGEATLPAWAECDYFCIHAYAGTGGASCGWRGQRHQITCVENDLRMLCPRCGNATLFRIPLGTDSF